MLSDKLKELEAARAKVSALEQAVASELRSELSSLPAKYGFVDVRHFLRAVRAAAKVSRGRDAKQKSAGPGTRRKRAVVTDEIRAEVKKLAELGKTGAEIAAQVGVSLPTVQNIKKALGLVQKRK